MDAVGLAPQALWVLNVGGFYDGLLALFDRAVLDGFLKPQNRAIVAAESDPAVLLDWLSVPPEGSEPK